MSFIQILEFKIDDYEAVPEISNKWVAGRNGSPPPAARSSGGTATTRTDI
jgi:hypothetical protein